MKLGEKIVTLRKKENLSQEQLAEKVGVTRQTISNWELGETVPDINQVKELSKIFQISIDEFVENDVQNILVEKVSNTEKLAGLVIKIIKFIGISILVLFIVEIIALILFVTFRKESTVSTTKSATLYCSIEENKYTISIGSDNYFDCPTCTQEMSIYLKDITDWANMEHSVQNIEKYFKDNGGTCD